MFNQIILSALLGLTAFWASYQVYPKLFSAPHKQEEPLSLEKTMEEIRRDLAEIAATPGETAGLVLDTVKVELTVQRQSDETRNGTLTIPVFDQATITASDAAKLTRGSKVAVSFSATGGDQLLDKGSEGELDLAELVLATRKALLASSDKDPKLVPKSVEIELQFVLVRNSSTGGKIKAYVIELGSKTEENHSAGNKISLSYVNPLLADKRGAPAGTRPQPPL